MRYRPISRSNFLLLILALPVAALAQNATVGVNATQTLRAVDERVFGVNSVIWDPEVSTAQTIGLVQDAGIRSIRVPGGSLSDEYHWRVNKTLTNTWTWSSHFGKFVQLISSANAQAMVTVNYGSGTPQEAAALVAYLNSPVGGNVAIGSDGSYDWGTSGTWAAVRASASPADEMSHLRIGRSAPLGAKYFEIGNECYGTWEHDDQVGSAKNDPTTYANRAQLYLQAMRAVDPTIKIGVVVVTSGENNSYKNWTPVMLARLKVLNAIPDFIIYHKYPQAPGQESDATLLQVGPAWAANATDLRQQLTTHLGASGAGVEIVVTENNLVYSSPGKQSTSLVNGLYLADSIANVMKTEINAFMWWGLRNGPPTINNGTALDGNMSASLYGWRQYGDYGMISTPSNLTGETTYYNRYPTYYAMRLLQYFARQGDTMVSATSSNNLLSVFAAKRANGSLSLFVINKDPVNTLGANIGLTGHNPAATATVYSYGKPQDDAAKPGGVGSPDIATTNMNIAGASFTASFAPYSITVIALNAAPTNVAPQITTQPQDQTVNAGGSVTFTAAASGTPVPTFQWKKNGVDVAGATGSSYTIATPVAGDSGSYVVVATNSAGSATSNAAILSVLTPRSDFDGNGISEPIWRNANTGEIRVWFMTGGSVGFGHEGGGWTVIKVGDFDGDGIAEPLWRNANTGEIRTWFMTGGSVGFGNEGGGWTVIEVGDFDGDGNAEPLWRNANTGEIRTWFLTGGSVGFGNEGGGWSVIKVGDFDGDGNAEPVWRNANTGEVRTWYLTGGSVGFGNEGGGWSVVNVGDFDGNGTAEPLWRNANTGEIRTWYLGGGSVGFGVEGGGWSVIDVGDFNGDGRAEPLWRNANTGEIRTWYPDGGSVGFGSEGGGWSVVH